MNILYDLGVRLSFAAPGVAMGVGQIMSQFLQLERGAASLEARFAALSQRLANPFGPKPGSKAQQSLMWQQSQIGTQLATAQAAAAQAQSGMNKLVGGAVLLGGGIAGLSMVKGWITAAAQMQQAVTQVGLATQNTNTKLQDLQTLGNRAYQIAAQTQFSAPQVVNIAQLAARSGYNNLQQLTATLPTFAQAAEIAMRVAGVEPQQSVPEFVRMAHTFRQWQGPGFNQMIGTAARALMVTGSTPGELNRVLQYLGPFTNNLGMNPEQTISLASLAMNLGLTGGRGGGSRLGAMFRSTVSAKGTKARELGLLEQAGGGQFFNQQGQFLGYINMLTVLSRAIQKIPNDRVKLKLISDVFGSAGSVAVNALASPQALGRNQSILTSLGQGKGALLPVNQMQQVLANTPMGQWTIFQTNLQSISAILGTQLLPAASGFLHVLVQISGAIMTFLSEHQGVAQFVAVFIAVSSAAALVIGPVLMAAGAMQILSAAGIAVDVAIWPITLTVLGVAAAIALLVLTVTHWSQITAAMGSAWSRFTRDVRAGWSLITTLGGDMVKILGLDKFGQWLVNNVPEVQTFVGLWKDLSSWLGTAANLLGDIWNKMTQLGFHNKTKTTAVVVPTAPYRPGAVAPSQTPSPFFGPPIPKGYGLNPTAPTTFGIGPTASGISYVQPLIPQGAIVINVNGPDHQTQRTQAVAIGDMVELALARSLQKSATNATVPGQLQPSAGNNASGYGGSEFA